LLNKQDKECGLDSAGSFESSNNASHNMSGVCVKATVRLYKITLQEVSYGVTKLF